jgi:hypothetical protein
LRLCAGGVGANTGARVCCGCGVVQGGLVELVGLGGSAYKCKSLCWCGWVWALWVP